MRVAIVGSSGYIAGYLIQKLSNMVDVEKIIKIDREKNVDLYVDLSNAKKFDYDFLENVDFVIFTAAVSSPDQCASDFNNCWKINVEGTEMFIREALNRKCRVLFFSSDAVFGNIPGKIYYEDSETLANTPYGIMKKHVEDTFKKEKNFKVIRLSYVVSANDRFIKYCRKCMKENCIAEIFHPFYRNCVVVDDVVKTVMWFLKYWDDFESFVLNVAGQELVSRIRIADELNRFFGDQLKYKIVVPNDNFFKNRPPITQMQSRYMSSYLILDETSFTEKIQNELKEESM